MTILRFLSGNSCTSFPLGSVSGDLFCSLDYAMFPCFFICLPYLFCWNLCIWKNNHLSQFCGLASYRGGPSVVSLTKDSEAFSNLVWTCTFSGLVYVPSQLEFSSCFYRSWSSIIYCSLWCSSLILQVFWCCPLPLCSPLYSASRRHPKYGYFP